MKLRTLVLTLATAALLPTFAEAAADPVAASFDRAFINDTYLGASRTERDQVAASFQREFGSQALVAAYRAKPDQAVASFERGLSHDLIATSTMLAKVDPLDLINRSLGLGNDAVAASFEQDLLGNATAAGQPDAVLASFERDLYREPVAVMAAVSQGEDAFSINEPDTILANFYRELHWMPDASAVFVR